MKRYEVQGVIGMGAYGVVLRAVNRQTGELVAIKKFKEVDADPLIHKMAGREVRMLRAARHPNIVRFIEAFRREGKLHLVFEFADRALLEDIERSPRGLAPEVVVRHMYQLLKALRHLHGQGLVHRDVKPENLLVTSGGELRLCDFGFARRVEEGGAMTEYVATRWYRAPELLLGTRYGTGADVWAAGCVFGELIDGQPVFAGEDGVEQLRLIARAVGPVAGVGGEESGLVERRFGGRCTAVALDLLLRMLRVDEGQRVSAAEAVEHPLFERLRRAEEGGVSKENESPNWAAGPLRHRSHMPKGQVAGRVHVAPSAGVASVRKRERVGLLPLIPSLRVRV